jgi:hypothetical protein
LAVTQVTARSAELTDRLEKLKSQFEQQEGKGATQAALIDTLNTKNDALASALRDAEAHAESARS